MEEPNFEKPTFNYIFYNPVMIYHFAKGFFNTGFKVISKYENHVVKNLGGNLDWNIYQKTVISATNISFSLELALKGLTLLTSGKICKEHSLFKLFNTLNPETQKLIANNQKIDKYASYRNICFGNTPSLDNHIDYVNGSIDEILTTLKEQEYSFINFRYFFEQGNKTKPLYFNFPAMLNITHNSLKVLNKLNMKNITSSQ